MKFFFCHWTLIEVAAIEVAIEVGTEVGTGSNSIRKAYVPEMKLLGFGEPNC